MKKKFFYYIGAVIVLALVAIFFFFPDDIEGRVLRQHDILQGIANSQEGKAYYEATGNTTRWTNALFGGMPNFQIAVSYPANDLFAWFGNIFMLGLPSPANLLFAMMLGFFIMCLCMRMKWQEALFGALAWGFSSYFIILIGAGHIWKFITLAYIPPTIGGIALCYRGKYLPGFALASLFGAMQLHSNHPQMTYYFLFVIIALILGWLYTAIRTKRMRRWWSATGCTIAAGILAVAANSASLYNTYEYAKETVRGKSTDLVTSSSTENKSGMDRAAITAWSYGIDETFTLLIPNVKGGATIQPTAGETRLKNLAETSKADELPLSPEERRFLTQFPQYFGDQPMTNGPVYVGAFVLLLAILALFTLEGPTKWALFGVSVLAILLSWGHNFDWFTNLFIDYFPGYNKFRAVSSILVIVEFTVPLLAVMCIRRMVEKPKDFTSNPWLFYGIFGIGALICLVGAISPSVFGSPFSQSEIEYLTQAGAFTQPEYRNVIDAIGQTRLSLVRDDALRSLIFIIIGGGCIWLYLFRFKKKDATVFVLILSAVMLVDLFSVNRRYVNSDNFAAPADDTEVLNMTEIDREILKDTTNYRVMDIDGMSQARSSYFHKTIGGYHAAKLTRYNDLLEHQIAKGNIGVINMLNTKYVIADGRYQVNPDANGNAWLIDSIGYVPDSNTEMASLDSLDTRRNAVADMKFKAILGEAIHVSPGDTIYETSYAPDRLTYKARTAKGGIAVFSEIYFPWGWYATVDGKPVDIGRVNYVLRAIRLTPGTHDIEFKFDPQSLKVTNAIGLTGVICIYAVCLLSLGIWLYCYLRRRNNSSESDGKGDRKN